MARRKGRKSSVRTPAKTMERELIHRAEQLAKDPGKQVLLKKERIINVPVWNRDVLNIMFSNP